MMKTIVLFLFLTGPLFALSNEQLIAEANNKFAIDLYKKLSQEDGNLFFSPFSISAVLAKVSAGAQGQTLKEIEKVLHLPINSHSSYKIFQDSILLKQKKDQSSKFAGLDSNWGSKLEVVPPKKEFELLLANRFWGSKNRSYNQNFLDTLQKNYNSGLTPLDFSNSPEASRQKINKWIEEKTKTLIKDLLPKGSITPVTDFVITNAIYFKAEWKKKFEKSETKEEFFFISPTQKVKTKFMNQTSHFLYASNSDGQYIELPYEGDEFAMVVLLPRKHIQFTEFEKKITPQYLDKISKSSFTHQVVVSLPKFKSRKKYEKMAIALRDLGLILPFSPLADFSGISNNNPFIGEIIHEAVIDIYEEGTEAAAATALIAFGVAHPGKKLEPMIFNANRAFLYYIKHKVTNAILFMGRYTGR